MQFGFLSIERAAATQQMEYSKMKWKTIVGLVCVCVLVFVTSLPTKNGQIYPNM